MSFCSVLSVFILFSFFFPSFLLCVLILHSVAPYCFEVMPKSRRSRSLSSLK
jgi:hypothetical protein